MTREGRAFSLVELLTAVGVIIILSALIAPTYFEAKREARRVTKTSQLRQLSAALLEYTATNEGGLPPFPYGTGTEWHNTIFPGPINTVSLALANPDKAETRTDAPFSFHIGYALNQCLMRNEVKGGQADSLNPYLVFQSTELRSKASSTIHKTWHLGCHDKQYANVHNLVPTDGRFLADIDNGGSLAARLDGSVK